MQGKGEGCCKAKSNFPLNPAARPNGHRCCVGLGREGVLGAAISEAGVRGEGKRALGLFSFSQSY